METITFVTGNQPKADYLAKYLGFAVEHCKLDLDELQSLDLKEVVEHKVKQAYEEVQSPVIVEDVSLEFSALGRLPGTFIKWFIEEIGLDGLCSLLDNKDRSATARCMFGYYDGQRLELIEGSLTGRIAEEPAGENGFGWDRIFIPHGFDITRAQMDADKDRETYLTIKPFKELKQFLLTV